MCDMLDGFLLGKKYLIHDRDTLFNKRFDMIFESIGVEVKKMPPFTPQMNSRMENFMRALKTECLDKIIFRSEAQLRLAVKEYLDTGTTTDRMPVLAKRWLYHTNRT